MIKPETWEKLRRRMERWGIREEDIEEQFIRGSGRGGQKINKTACCVRLFHRPSGLEIRCEKTRSQADNRYWARRELCERIEERILGEESARRREIARIRRKKQRRSRRARLRMLEEKKRRGEKKRLRRRVDPAE